MNNPISAVLKLAILDNAWLYLPKSYEIEDLSSFSTILAISKTLGREFSFCTRIDKIEFKDIEIPELYANKYIVNALLEGDSVLLVPFQVPTAESITLIVSDNSSVYDGSWDKNVSNQFDNQILDIGGELLVTWPSSNPFIVKTILSHSQPQAPIRLTENTSVYVKKMDEIEIQDKISVANDKKVQRIAKYEAQMEESTLELIGEIKCGNLSSIRTEFDFIAAPLTIYSGIKNMVNSWKCTHDVKDTHDEDFTAGLDFILFESKNRPIAMIDFFIMSKKDEGKVVMNVYARNQADLDDLNSKITKDIRTLSITVKNTNKIIDNNCPNCGKSFNFIEIDERGWIECEGCYSYIEVPAKYRYM